jgi:hypothetical protein
VAAHIPGWRPSLALALEQISHQRPLGIGQVGVHAAGAIGAPVGGGIAVSRRGCPLTFRALTRAAQRLESHNAGLAQRLAHRDGADLDPGASKQRARHLVQRRARLLLGDRTQHSRVLGVQRGLTPRPSCLFNLCSLDHRPTPRPRNPQSKHNVRDVVFVYTLSGPDQ